MLADQYRDFLLSHIPTATPANGGKQVHCRCFFCPDSSNPNSKHFYISIPENENEPSLYYCHKCHNSGIVTPKKLIEWDIFEDEMGIELTFHNRTALKTSKFSKYTSNVKYNIFNFVTTNSEISRIKLEYINKRLGTELTFEELRNLKIVLNLKDILKSNNITYLTRDPKIIDQLDINFLGFLSIDNAFLNMRRICDEGLVYKTIDKRYINYKLFDKDDTSERFYTIPSEIDLSNPERVKIHVAEGPFDILSIYKNLRHEERGIYTSIGGSNYKGIAMYFLEKFRIPYSEFHYYPDNDKFGSNDNMEKIATYLRSLNIPMFLHRNTMPNEKDFGVSLDRIRETIIQLG